MMEHSEDQLDILMHLDVAGEEYAKEFFAAMNQADLKLLVSHVYHVEESQRESLREHMPDQEAREATAQMSLHTLLSLLQIEYGSEGPIDPHAVITEQDAVMTVLRWYGKRFGEAEGWRRLCTNLNAAQMTKVFRREWVGENQMVGVATSARKGCGGAVVLVVGLTVVAVIVSVVTSLAC